MSNHDPASYAFDAAERKTDEQDQRARAVAAAIGLIEAKVAGSDSNLKIEMANLSGYADKIQEALKVK
ncbi:hypothetical protein EX349_06475 [Pseudomonas protegens]|uniref:hypothetical protein n=1 Tax=Pseudomonas protegens TaxID=380021 RepID=UPI00137305BB|nr:hypothetical protein [Pseudomonas protegens]NAN50837.1 hypothetical protein [Pseudomonas protegens]NUE77388.1 hypothetical protein [Pseudomonas protegens]